MLTDAELQAYRILHRLPTGHCILGPGAEILFWNQSLEVWTEQEPETVLGRSLFEAFPNLDKPRYKERIFAALQQGVPAVFAYALNPQFFPSVRRGGVERVQHTTVDRLEPSPDGEARVLITVTDVTDQVLREERVRAARAEAEKEAQIRKASEERFRVLVELAADAIFIAQADGRILDCNSAAGWMFQRPWDEFTDLNLKDLVSRRHHHLFDRLVAAEGSPEFDRVEVACLRMDRSSFPAELSARTYTAGHLKQFVVYAHDITERKRAEEALRKANEALENLSFTDPLTGLRNRRFFSAYIPGDLQRSLQRHAEGAAEGRDLVFILVDLDHFKQVNDTHGHHAGDLVLQQLAYILTSALRQTDLVVRWGGEEFLLVAREANRQDAATLAERVRRDVEKYMFDLGNDQVLRRTCSIGCAVFPFEPSDPARHSLEDLVALADHALYAAKRSGRNAWVLLSPTGPLPQDLGRALLLERTAQLAAEGVLEVRTNLPDPAAIAWP